MANTIDLLGSGSLTSQRNSFISKPFILYQIITMAASILSPATICLMISGSLSLILHIDPKYALILATVPPVLYLVLCFKLKLDTQVTIAAIMSALYAFLMMGTALFIMGAMVEEQTIWNPSGLFIIGMVLTNTITAALHPKGVPSGRHLRPPLLHLYPQWLPPADHLLHGQHEQRVLGHPGDRGSRPSSHSASYRPSAAKVSAGTVSETVVMAG
ncbi:hypothetical protein J4Q44_G00014970 [Coregonus suidteri]|uniref:Uncharacterized protein n=1 Tax=Coregonus suidteri TaxID=861788 RepID=A0AAN8MI78_9TELE